jgi:hypothetical protein
MYGRSVLRADFGNLGCGVGHASPFHHALALPRHHVVTRSNLV